MRAEHELQPVWYRKEQRAIHAIVLDHSCMRSTPLIHWSALILRNLLTIVCVIYKQKYRCYTAYGCFRCQYRSILNLK